MSVEKEANGRRAISVEVEVPGTPEEVWEAIATGSGISKWFVPAQVEPHVGGKMVLNFGPGMDSASEITAWDAPHRLPASTFLRGRRGCSLPPFSDCSSSTMENSRVVENSERKT